MSDNEIEKRITLERSIVRSLIRHLKTAGFNLHAVNNGEEVILVSKEAQALDHVFSVDESSLRFQDTNGAGRHLVHGVLLVGGNGEDIISDWNYTDGDPDGFDKAMGTYLDTLTK